MPWRSALVAAAIGAAFVRLPPTFVERFLRARLYAGMQPLLTSMSNLAPFALFDLLVLGVVVSWFALGARDLVRVKGRVRALALIAWRGIVWAAALYVVFLLVWGLNYRRVRLVDALAVDAAHATPLAVRDAAMTAADRMNTLHARAHAEGWPAADTIDPNLAEALDRGDRHGAQGDRAGRPKRTLLDWYFRARPSTA